MRSVARHGRSIGDWLGAIGELEALSALATFSSENPDYVFPEIVSGPARFEGEALAHPFLPLTRRSRRGMTGSPPRLTSLTILDSRGR